MDDLKRFVEQDAFARHLGIVVYGYGDGDGSASARLVVGPQHFNSAGTLHGGVIFSLADAAFSAASNSHGTLAASIEASVSYFRATTEGEVTAHAREISRSAKLATYLIDVMDGSGALLAHFRGTVYRKSTPLVDVLAP